jgi:hypothetical protein
MQTQRIILAVIAGLLMTLCYVVTDFPLQFSIKKIVVVSVFGVIWTTGMLRNPKYLTSPFALGGIVLFFGAICAYFKFAKPQETFLAVTIWSLSLLTVLLLRATLEHRHKNKSR